MKIDLSEADYGDDLEWQIIAEPGDTVSWKKARPLDEVPCQYRAHTRSFKADNFSAARSKRNGQTWHFHQCYVVR